MMNIYNLFFTFLCFYHGLVISSTQEVCDKSRCPGPLQYYKIMKCKPIYKSSNDCCAYKYDCDHLKQRSIDKCYINGHEYSAREAISREDSGDQCDYKCVCLLNKEGIAWVHCIYEIFVEPKPPKPECYYPKNASYCGYSELICSEKTEDRPTCKVEGETYLDGDFFLPSAEPHKICYCGPGYTGQNVRPFCTEPQSECYETELKNQEYINQKCAPILSTWSNCTESFRCPAESDEIIKAKENDLATANSDVICEYGNLTMNYGDELNLRPNYYVDCVKCVCDVGPALSCSTVECN